MLRQGKKKPINSRASHDRPTQTFISNIHLCASPTILKLRPDQSLQLAIAVNQGCVVGNESVFRATHGTAHTASSTLQDLPAKGTRSRLFDGQRQRTKRLDKLAFLAGGMSHGGVMAKSWQNGGRPLEVHAWNGDAAKTAPINEEKNHCLRFERALRQSRHPNAGFGA
jgi:hypothetical protein